MAIAFAPGGEASLCLGRTTIQACPVPVHPELDASAFVATFPTVAVPFNVQRTTKRGVHCKGHSGKQTDWPVSPPKEYTSHSCFRRHGIPEGQTTQLRTLEPARTKAKPPGKCPESRVSFKRRCPRQSPCVFSPGFSFAGFRGLEQVSRRGTHPPSFFSFSAFGDDIAPFVGAV